MSLGRYLLGLGGFAICVAAIGFGAACLRSRYLPGWRGAPARLAEVVIATSALLLVLELLGTAQILDSVPIVLGCLTAGAAMAYVGTRVRPEGTPDGGIEFPGQMGRWATAL